MNKLQQMEDRALEIGYCMREISTHDWVEVIDEGSWFRYTFNGKYKRREEIVELISDDNEAIKDF